MYFGHERLDVYQLALGVARWAAQQAIPPARKHLRDQLFRAVDSVVLNIAEGAGLPPGDGQRNHFRIAGASAAEVSAILDLLTPPEYAERQVELRRVGAMLARMVR